MTAISPATPIPEEPSSPFSIPTDGQQLRDAIIRLAGHINAAEYRFLKLIDAMEEGHHWCGGEGFKTPAHWLNYACGIDLGAAREKFRVARCLKNLPRIDEAFRQCKLSYSKVRAMTRAATRENEEFLLMVARHGTASHVENLVRKYQWTKRLNAQDQAKTQHDARELSWYYDNDGMLVFKGKLPPEEGAAFLKALDAAFDDLHYNVAQAQAGDMTFPRKREAPAQTAEAANDPMEESAPPETSGDVSAETDRPDPDAPTIAQKRADALTVMAESALAGLHAGRLTASTADKYQVVIHIEPDRLKPGAESGPGHQFSMESAGGQLPLPPATVRRLACDSSLLTVLEDADGKVLNVGRRTRTIPPAIRRALKARDHGCQFPGCCESRYVDAHHIRHWCDGGETSLDNLVLLCRKHHRTVHQDGYELVKAEDGRVDFIHPEKGKLERAKYPQFSEPGDPLERLAIEEDNEREGLDIDCRTAKSLWLGEAMDYGLAVASLYAKERQSR